MKSFDVDGAILDAIREGRTKFHQIQGKLKFEYRLIDRRLQVLRKAKKISFDTKKGWGLRHE